MDFKIINGEGVIYIGVNRMGSYAFIKHPVSAVWNEGGIQSNHRYYCHLSDEESSKLEVGLSVQWDFEKDYTGQEQRLCEIMSEVWKKFKNGHYAFNYYNNINGEFFQTDSGEILPFELKFCEQSQQATTFSQSIDEWEMNLGNFNFSMDQLKDKTDFVFNGAEFFYATISLKKIDESTVQHYVKQIQDGKRPFAIIINAYDVIEDCFSSNFIMDGHHKLIAYQRLNIFPPLLVIRELITDDKVGKFDWMELSNYLYPAQLNHWIMKMELDEVELQTLSSSKSGPNLQRLIKQGEIAISFPNGQLKYQGFFENNVLHGTVREWWENGNLKLMGQAYHGRKFDKWINYYENGGLAEEINYNDYGLENGNAFKYNEDGQLKAQQHWNNGKLHDGPSIQYWYDNGQRRSIEYYKHGKLENVEYFSEDGTQVDEKGIPLTGKIKRKWWKMILPKIW